MESPVEYKTRCTGFKQFLPKTSHLVVDGRKQDLVQIFTDPGGQRTLTLDSIVSVR